MGRMGAEEPDGFSARTPRVVMAGRHGFHSPRRPRNAWIVWTETSLWYQHPELLTGRPLRQRIYLIDFTPPLDSTGTGANNMSRSPPRGPGRNK